MLPLTIIIVVSHALAAVVSVNWNVGWTAASPDGIHRSVIGVNGSWPIPPIEAYYNDTLVLTVQNSMPVPITLHMHGLFQRGKPYLDGAQGVTQCGIPPKQSFTYTILVQQTGTFWIHGHFRGLYADGLRTPLIFRNRTAPPIDEYTVALAGSLKSSRLVPYPV